MQDLRNRSTDERLGQPLSTAERNTAHHHSNGLQANKNRFRFDCITGLAGNKNQATFFYKVLLTIWIFSSLATFVSGYLISQHSLSTQKQRWRDDPSRHRRWRLTY